MGLRELVLVGQFVCWFCDESTMGSAQSAADCGPSFSEGAGVPWSWRGGAGIFFFFFF